MDWLGWPSINGKGFSKISKPANEMAPYMYVPFAIRFLNIVLGWRENGNWKFTKWQGNFRCSILNRKRGLPLEEVHNWNRCSRKLLCYLILITAEMKVFLKNVKAFWDLNKTCFDCPAISVSCYNLLLIVNLNLNWLQQIMTLYDLK